MNYNIYSIFDRVTGNYGDLCLFRNDEDAKRRVAYSMKENPYKEDLQLYCLGEYNVETGELLPKAKPAFICGVIECYGE